MSAAKIYKKLIKTTLRKVQRCFFYMYKSLFCANFYIICWYKIEGLLPLHIIPALVVSYGGCPAQALSPRSAASKCPCCCVPG